MVLREGSDATEADLQNFLSKRFSWSRMPKRILVLDTLPKGPTGKLQRIGLAEKLGLKSVRKDSGESDGVVTVPTTGTLERVASLWRDVLKNPDVKVDDPFLESGGDSVTATVMVIRVEEEFSVKVPLLAFFDAATIRRQAELIDQLLSDRGAGKN